MTNSKENTLKAIRYQKPAFVPVFDGAVWEAVQLGGNFKNESWTDHWGVRWHMELAGLVPVDIEHPLADIKKMDSYDWPDPQRLKWTKQDQEQLDSIDRQKTLVGGLHIKFLCERLCCLMGMDNFMGSMYEDPRRLQVMNDPPC